MSDDVTIPRKAAKDIANRLRIHGAGRHRVDGQPDLRYYELADLLDPPKRSLRDEVADIIRTRSGNALPGEVIADEVIALVTRYYRKRIQLLAYNYKGEVAYLPSGRHYLHRDSVLDLFPEVTDE